MRIITYILKDALRKDVIDKTLKDKLIVRPVSKPPMIIDNKKEVKNTAKELSIFIKSKTGC